MTNPGSIKTTYLGPTDTSNARIRVAYGSQSGIVQFDHSASNAHTSAIAQVMHINPDTLIYRDDHKHGKWYDLAENPVSTLEFAFYVMSPTVKIAAFNSEMLAREYLQWLNQYAVQLNISIWTRKQVQEII